MNPYEEGYCAWGNCVPREDNPYDGLDAEEWDDGWIAADDDAWYDDF